VPAIYRIECDQCDFRRLASQSATFVLGEDDSWEIVGHPVERLRAERTTGEPWSKLVADGRIAYRYGAICRHCGTVDFYPVTSQPRRDHVWSITRMPTTKDLADTPCSSCSQAELLAVTDKRMTGMLCPQCQRGEVHVATGIS
jgi:hypothetical protein